MGQLGHLLDYRLKNFTIYGLCNRETWRERERERERKRERERERERVKE